MSSIFTISAASSARDFWKTLYDRNMMTDCVLYVRNTHQQGGDSIHDPHQIYREYRCHRLLLAGHSQFFRQCFLSTTSSTTPTVVLLDSIESHIFESIVHLIYTGVVEVLDKDREAFQKAINTLELIDFGVGEPRSESTGLVSFESNDFTTSQVKRFKLDDNSMKPSLPMHYSPDNNNDQVIDALDDYVAERSKASPMLLVPPPSTSLSEPGYACPVCHKQYSYKISLNKHIKCTHPTHHNI